MTHPAPSQRVPQSEVVRHWLRNECEAAAAGREAGPVVARGTDDALPAPGAVASLSGREALDLLLRAKPGAAGFLARDEAVAWYRTAVNPGAFPRLRLVESPPGTLWRALAPDRSPVTAARAVAAGDPDALADGTGVDVRRMLAMRDSLDGGTRAADPLVVRTRRGRAPWTIVDGNHRAVARAMELVDPSDGAETAVTDDEPRRRDGEPRRRDGEPRHRDGEPRRRDDEPRRRDDEPGNHDGEFAPQPVYLGVRPNPVVRPLRERLGGLVWRLLGRPPAPA